MESSFEYNKQTIVMGNIDIKDISHFAIECSNDEGKFWYMIVKTLAGESTILTFGPVVPDTQYFYDFYNCSLMNIAYKEPKICNLVDKFINDRSKNITKIEEINIEDALDQCQDVKLAIDN